MIVDNIDLAVERGRQQELARSILLHLVDAADDLRLPQLEAVGVSERPALLLGNLHWILVVLVLAVECLTLPRPLVQRLTLE